MSSAMSPEDSTRLQDVFRTMLQVVDPHPDRQGIADTPARMAKAWAEWTSGYHKDAGEILKCFEDGANGCDQIVVVRDIPIHSFCEHHLASIFGTATIGYLPNGKIVGLSKLSRLADMFADALMEHLQPLGCGVMINARHMCMESRGVCQQGTSTVTSALRGAFRDDPQTRAEFLNLAHGDRS
jgi:GTP cyclohydrolase I